MNLTQENRAARRGDIYYASLRKNSGSEQGGVRPVLIVQNDIGNRHSPTVIAAAVTNKRKHGYLPTHVKIPGRICGLPQDSTAMLEQLRTLDKSRLGRYAGSLDPETQRRIDRALEISVGLVNDEREGTV